MIIFFLFLFSSTNWDVKEIVVLGNVIFKFLSLMNQRRGPCDGADFTDLISLHLFFFLCGFPTLNQSRENMRGRNTGMDR